MPTNLRPEPLAYWYLRLNGFLTIPNFVVHPDTGSNQGTDIDALGVRFPDRAENLICPMADDPRLVSPDRRVHFVLAEVKNGGASINPSWLDPQRRNVLRTIRAVGVADPARSERIAERICSKGGYTSPRLRAEIVCLCERTSAELSRRLPNARQITWDDIMTFIYSRFRAYIKQKRSHGQWDETGQLLWDVMVSSRNAAAYVASLKQVWQPS